VKTPVPALGNGTQAALQDLVSKALSEDVPQQRRGEFSLGEVRRSRVIEAFD
jgi:hypothetical protein